MDEVIETETNAEIENNCDDEMVIEPEINIEKSIQMPFLRKFSIANGKLSRSDLEQIILEKISENLLYHSVNSELRLQYEKQEKMIECLYHRVNTLSKQYADLDMVHKRVISDLKNNNPAVVTPIKITRAVGLQVYLPAKIMSTNSPSKDLARKSIVEEQPVTCPVTNIKSDPIPSNSNSVNIPKAAPDVKKRMFKITPMRPPLTDREKANLEIQEKKEEILIRSNATKSLTAVKSISKPQTSSITTNINLPPSITMTASTLTSNLNNKKAKFVPYSSSGRILLKQVSNFNSTIKLKPTTISTNACSQSIDLTDDTEDTVTSSSKRLTAAKSTSPLILNQLNQQPPALVAIRANNLISVTKQNSTESDTSKSMYVIGPSIPQQNESPLTITHKPTRTYSSNLRSFVPKARPQHPAPLPSAPTQISLTGYKKIPPSPNIRIDKISSGIVVSWSVDGLTAHHAEIKSYQIFAYEENEAPVSTENWRHVGDVKALLLPMAVTLTQFQENRKYHFAVRAIDVHDRMGQFSIPKTWSADKKTVTK